MLIIFNEEANVIQNLAKSIEYIQCANLIDNLSKSIEYMKNANIANESLRIKNENLKEQYRSYLANCERSDKDKTPGDPDKLLEENKTLKEKVSSLKKVIEDITGQHHRSYLANCELSDYAQKRKECSHCSTCSHCDAERAAISEMRRAYDEIIKSGLGNLGNLGNGDKGLGRF